MSAMSITFTHIGLTFKAECDVEPFVRGKYSGPPESCYPDEGGYAEITDLTVDGADASFLLGSDLADALNEAAYDACVAEGERMADDAAESRAADRAEERRYG